MQIPDKAFDFWKAGKINGYYQLTEGELTERFQKWLAAKEEAWVNYYSSERAIRLFITDNEGLSSAFEEKSFDAIYHILNPLYLNHY